MSTPLHEVGRRSLVVDEAALARARTALVTELGRPRPPGWRRDAVALLLSGWAMALLAALALAVLGQTGVEALLRHAPSIGVLVLVGAACGWAAMGPPTQGRRLLGGLAAVLGLVGVVVSRALTASAAGNQPEWVCLVSHLALGLAPLVFALALLRRSAFHRERAIFAGLAVGTTGALIGELACDQGWQHVAVFHLGAWLALGVATAVIAPRLRRWSYAP